MKKCDYDDCEPLCDFCKFYKGTPNVYGERICSIYKKRRDPVECCKRFHCIRAVSKKIETKALKKALKIPEIQMHLRRKKAAWKNPNPSSEIIYRWVQQKLAENLYPELMKTPISILLKMQKGGLYGLKKNKPGYNIREKHNLNRLKQE